MEGAGLAFGVLAIVGIFNDCKDLLACFLAAKSMGDDYDELVLRFNYQRKFLNDWAERVCLFDQQNYDKRLDERRVSDLVAQSLLRIHKLLQDGGELQKRYGLKPSKTRSMSRFREISQKFRSAHSVQQLQLDQHVRTGRPMKKNDENKYSIVHKITWIIKDKERFEGLLMSLTNLIKCMNDATPPLKIVTINTLPQNEKYEQHPIADLKTIDNLEPKRIERVLNRLWFRFIDDRKESIKNPHFKTFEWAVRSPTPETRWDDLRQWLRSGNDIYWISGKPGSGKSTLMKYLFGHPEVAELLEEWAGNQKLTMASFFLWNVGSSEQNTQYGLARGLLYHVLEKNHSLIPVVLPDMWREAQKPNMDIKPPSSTELHQAFQRLGKESTEGVFAFFIDGIDEFTGNYREGISFIQNLANSVRIKMLLSSREINECTTAFSMKPKMRLQDLTKRDIGRYVNSAVRSYLSRPNKSQLSQRDIHALVMSLQHKAKGVFLWVLLACQRLFDCFDACGKAEELEKVIDELPPELEDLFRGMLESVPRAYQQEAAKLLRVCYTHVSRFNNYHHPIATFSLAWAYEKEMALEKMHDFTRFSVDEIRQQCTTFEVRLRSLCKGLLEINGDFSRDYPYKLTGGPSYVEFMHRTVFEYLGSPAAQEMNCLKIHDDAFDPFSILAYMQAYQIYLSQEPVMSCGWVESLFEPLMVLSHFSPAKLPQVLDRFVLALMEPRNLHKPGTAAFNNRYLPFCLAGTSNDTLESFFGYSQHELSKEHAALLLAVELHLYDFVKNSDIAGFNALQRSQHPDATERRNLLFHAIQQPMLRSIDCDWENFNFSREMMEMLLDSGCDPNQTIVLQEVEDWEQITTPWHGWVPWVYNDVKFEGIDNILTASIITTKMLEAGADLYPKIITIQGDLRLYLLREIADWIQAFQKTESKQICLQIVEYSVIILEAVRSSINKNPFLSGSEDSFDLKEHSSQLMDTIAAFLEQSRLSFNETSAVMQKNEKGKRDKRDEEDERDENSEPDEDEKR